MKLTLNAWLRSGVAALGLAAPPTMSADAIHPGVHATYQDATGREWCVTVIVVDVGPGATPWAWFTIDDDPRRVGRTPVIDLSVGCQPDRLAAQR